MRPSRRLGGVVLLLLSVSGCAAVQSRMNGPARNPEDPPPSRSSGWFGSKLSARPTPTSASSAAATAVTPDVETARPTAPETDIWPVPRSSGLTRLLPILGNRDQGGKTATVGDVYPTLASLPAPAATLQGNNDSQVKPASGNDPELLPSPTAVQVPVKRHDRPETRGAVALEVAPRDLDEGDEATRGTSPRDPAVSAILELPDIGQPARGEPALKRPRREDYLIATAASAAEATTTGGDGLAQPSTSSPQPAQPAVGQQPTTPKPPAAAPSTTPSAGPPPPPLGPTTPSAGPPPRPLGPTTPSTGPPPPPLGPATSPPPATNPAPVSPMPPASSLPTPAVAPAPVPVPVPEPAPTAEPGPRPAPAAPEAELPVPVPAPVPAGQGLAASPAPAASGQGSQDLAQASPSPQASLRSAGKPAQPPHKSCRLLDWIHSWHQPAPLPPPPNCQLPPVTFPTTYQTCMPWPRPTGPTLAGSVHPAPQSPQASPPHACSCTTKAPKAPCFSWFHYGMASDFFVKVRSWRHGCACRCHESEFRLWWGNCKRCASKCDGPAAPKASPQAGSSPVLPQSQSGLGSGNPVPSNLAEGDQALERIASQGLDKTP